MNGMKQGLIIGAIAGLFFGFMLGRYGADKNTNKAWQQRTTALKKGGKRNEKNRVVKTGFRGGNKAPSRVAKVKGVGNFKRTFVNIGKAPVTGPSTALVTIVEFSDFECPFCTRGANTIKQVIKEYGNKVRVAFKHQPLSFHKNAHLAAQAAMAAHEQGKFWDYHDLLFKNRRRLQKSNLISYAKVLGLNLAKFKAALDSGKYKAYVTRDSRAGSSIGANGTPTFFINGRKLVGAQPISRFRSIINQEIAIASKLVSAGVKPAQVYAKIVASAPKAPKTRPIPRFVGSRAKFNFTGKEPSWGPKNAKVTIVEFSDFQCPFCNRGAQRIDQIKKNYAGKVRVVFRHLPLSFHKQAHLAAQASMAAHAQGKFWPYHDKLFANYRNLNKANFIKWAKELGLNVAKFKADLDSGKYKAYVDADLASARTAGANGTPTFLINGQKVVGAQPFARFKQVIDAALSGKKAPAPTRARRPRPKAPTGPVKIIVGAAPTWGPKTAKVTLVEFSDFQCPFCTRGAKTVSQLKKMYGNKLRVVFKHQPLSFHKQAHIAAQASMAAHEQGKFWQFHDKLFANNRNLSKANFLKWAKELGLDVAKFKAALDSGKYKTYVDKDKAFASSVGANGTPTFFINGQKLVGAQPLPRFKAMIDAALSGKKVAAPTAPRRPAPGARVKIAIGKSPVLGSKLAKVTIVEFSDFECPFCTRGANTIKKIVKEYGSQVRVVFKHLPLSFHRNAHMAAQASMAAHAQGKFWEFHDKLFANSRNLSKANYLKWAKELGLDVAKFKAALDSGKYKAFVDANAAKASSVGANGTPTFFINGKKLVGAQPFARFKQVIDAELKK